MCIFYSMDLHLFSDNEKMHPKKLRIRKRKFGVLNCLTKYAIDSVVWRFEDKLEKNIFIINRNLLYINHAMDSNAGLYECEGQVSVNGNFVASGQVEVYGESIVTC